MNNEENKPIETTEENASGEEIKADGMINNEEGEAAENLVADDVTNGSIPGSVGVIDNINIDEQIEENEYRDALREAENETDEENHPKQRINSPLKVAAVILCTFALIFAAFMLFINPTPDKALKNSGLVGTWLSRTGDIATYYTFCEDGRLLFTSGTIDSVSGYGIELDTDKTFYIYTYGKDPEETKAGALQYDVYNEDGVQTLKILTSATTGKDIILKKSELPSDLVKPVENFKGDDALLGEWYNEEQGLTLVFSDDGLLRLDFNEMVYNTNYSIKDNEIEFTYYKDFSEESKLSDKFYYTLEGDTMNLYMSDPADSSSPIVFERVLPQAKADK